MNKNIPRKIVVPIETEIYLLFLSNEYKESVGKTLERITRAYYLKYLEQRKIFGNPAIDDADLTQKARLQITTEDKDKNGN